MSNQNRQTVEQWKQELQRERQIQPAVPPQVVRAAGAAFRRLRERSK